MLSAFIIGGLTKKIIIIINNGKRERKRKKKKKIKIKIRKLGFRKQEKIGKWET
jgi:hypothetical protein